MNLFQLLYPIIVNTGLDLEIKPGILLLHIKSNLDMNTSDALLRLRFRNCGNGCYSYNTSDPVSIVSHMNIMANAYSIYHFSTGNVHSYYQPRYEY